MSLPLLYPLVSAAQKFSDAQKAQARANIGAIAKSDLSVATTTKTAIIDTTLAQNSLTFDITPGKNALRIFDIYADVAVSANSGTPLVEIVNGSSILNRFYVMTPVASGAMSLPRFKLCSVADTSNNLSSITVRISYSGYFLNGGDFSVTMSEVYL